MNIIFHETLHAIFDVYCLDEKDSEERIVECVANGLTALFVDNPKLIDYIKGAIK